MRKLLPILFACLTYTPLFAQKFEIGVQASAAFFHYTGNYATQTTYIGPSASPTNVIDKRDNNPYGAKTTVSNSFGVQAQYVAKQGIIGGLGLAIENFRSEVHADEMKGTYPQSFPFDAKSTLAKQFLNLNPYLGYRIQLDNVKIDLMPGVDIGVSMSSRRTVKSLDEGKFYLTEDRVKDIPVDYRLRFGSAVYFHRIGLIASYSHGMSNYVATTKGAENVARSEAIRLGLSYKFY